MIIKNFAELGVTKLRKDALSILEAGLNAIQVKNVLEDHVFLEGSVLTINGFEYDLSKFNDVFLVGIGKCAFDACAFLEDLLEDYLSDGIVLDVRGGPLKRLRSEVGTHPMPSDHNMKITQDIVDMLDVATENDLVLTVISGGGSALLCLPNDLSCEQVADLTAQLMNKGAPIHELNIVRQHTSKIQGGQLAKISYPAKVVSMIFSDVPGDDIGVIASGPTVQDKTTVADADAVLEKYKVKHSHDSGKTPLVETPKDEKYFQRVDNILVLNNVIALNAMKSKAEGLGYVGVINETDYEGSVGEAAEKFLNESTKPNTCNLYGGETTVIVKNKNGKGGRNQALALSGLMNIRDNVVLIAAASDGWDNGDIAGALVDSLSRKASEDLGLDSKHFLDQDLSYDFFEKVGGQIVTGRTGVNVSDIYLTLSS